MGLIAIINYGSGNLKSVYNALKNIKGKNTIVVTSSAKEIKKCSHIILPGVGSFESCIKGLKKSSLLKIIEEKVIELKTPFLGICVGMQMLANKGYENGEFKGLGWIKGSVKKILPKDKNLKIPHMGWNDLIFEKNTPFTENLKKKIKKYGNLKNLDAYFVHSYNFFLDDNLDMILSTEYGQKITAMVMKNNILGTQFHPEKSHDFGLIFLETFIESVDY